MQTSEMKACPFCGCADNIAGQYPHHLMWAIDCECGASIQGDTEAEAIAAWNRRAVPDDVRAAAERIITDDEASRDAGLLPVINERDSLIVCRHILGVPHD